MKHLLLDLLSRVTPSRTIINNCLSLINREVVGVSKYGVTLPDAGLTHEQLLQHGLEEALDLANYLEAAQQTARNSGLDHAELLGMILKLTQSPLLDVDAKERLKSMLFDHETARTLRSLRHK